MSNPSQNEITQMLLDLHNGKPNAGNELFSKVYDELKRIAGSQMRRERINHTLQPTALVHEAYIRLVDPKSPIEWQNRAQFFAIAAKLMRRVLIDSARARSADKRGGKIEKVMLEGMEVGDGQSDGRNVDLIALDDALKELESYDTLAHTVVEYRFFAGMTNEEVAEVIGVSEKTVKRKWATAKNWLGNKLEI